MRFNLVLIMSFALLVRNSLAIMLLYIYHYAYDQYLCFPDCYQILILVINITIITIVAVACCCFSSAVDNVSLHLFGIERFRAFIIIVIIIIFYCYLSLSLVIVIIYYYHFSLLLLLVQCSGQC